MFALLCAGAVAATPTPAQEQAIRRAAIRYEKGSKYQSVKVRDIQVSDDGRWAQAVVDVSLRGQHEYSAITWYRLRHGRWAHSLDPAPDGMFDDPNAPPRWLVILILVIWGVALWGAVDVRLQPRSAFVDAGKSQPVWFGLMIVGFLGPSLIAYPYYLVRVRPEIVKAGGNSLIRNAGTAVSGLARGVWAIVSFVFSLIGAIFSGDGSSGGPPPRPAPAGPPTGGYTPPPQERVCGACGGGRTHRCGKCGTNGYEIGLSPDGNRIWVPCGGCGGRAGRAPCEACGGSGKARS